jgi:hypothetical protein
VATLGNTSDQLRADIENELLGQGLRTITPMVLGMGIALTVAGVVALDAAAWFTCTTQPNSASDRRISRNSLSAMPYTTSASQEYAQISSFWSFASNVSHPVSGHRRSFRPQSHR